MREIVFQNNGQEVRLQSTGNFVIVGANGSGKSHLGALIERLHPNEVLRISAQRALNVPERVNISDYNSSWNQLQYGTTNGHNKANKWGNDSDYTIRITRLFRQYSPIKTRKSIASIMKVRLR